MGSLCELNILSIFARNNSLCALNPLCIFARNNSLCEKKNSRIKKCGTIFNLRT